MAWKCCDCGHIFEDGEEKTVKEYHGEFNRNPEEFVACPVCGSTDVEKAKHCRSCGGTFLKEELNGGYYCDDCLKELIDYDAFREFATSGVNHSDYVDAMEDFIFSEVFHVDTPSYSSSDLKAYCLEIYNREVEKDTAPFQTRHDFLDKIYDYFYSNSDVCDDFAEFLHESEVKKRED